MNNLSTRAGFEVRFTSLFAEGRALVFPCDAKGHVDIDELPDRAKHNYLYARALIGRDYSLPRVCAALASPGS